MTPLLYKLDPDRAQHVAWASEIAQATFRCHPDGDPPSNVLEFLEHYTLTLVSSAWRSHGADDLDIAVSRRWVAHEWSLLYLEMVDARRSQEAAE